MDKRAERILAGTFWESGGWRRVPQWPTSADSSYAERAGYMFASTVGRDHDELVAATRALATRLSLDEASSSFVASLSTRHRFLRSFLPSMVVARRLPDHVYQPDLASRGPCVVCGSAQSRREDDLNVLSFERHRWGGVRHLDLAYLWFTLDRFEAEGGADPDTVDFEMFTTMVENLRALDPSTTLTKAEAALRHLPSSKDERLTILEQLSIVGVLQDPAHPGFLNRFVNDAERQLPGKRFQDRKYPGEWWTAAAGVDGQALQQLFRYSR